MLEYSESPGNTWDMYHTEVPPENRGQGLAADLAKVQTEVHTYNSEAVNEHIYVDKMNE